MMNIDGNILNQTLAKQLKQYIRRIIYHDQVRYIPGMQKFFNVYKSINHIDHIHNIKNKKWEKSVISSIDVEEGFLKNATFIYKNSLQMV